MLLHLLQAKEKAKQEAAIAARLQEDAVVLDSCCEFRLPCCNLGGNIDWEEVQVQHNEEMKMVDILLHLFQAREKVKAMDATISEFGYGRRR